MIKKVLYFVMIFSFNIVHANSGVYSASSEAGEKAFQKYSCMACHTIGNGKLVGPDLNGVTAKRDSTWLIRWIMEPDKVLAEGDVIATELLEEFKNIPMPPMGLNESEAKDILAYIESKSDKITTTEVAPISTVQECTYDLSYLSQKQNEYINAYNNFCKTKHSLAKAPTIGYTRYYNAYKQATNRFQFMINTIDNIINNENCVERISEFIKNISRIRVDLNKMYQESISGSPADYVQCSGYSITKIREIYIPQKSPQYSKALCNSSCLMISDYAEMDSCYRKCSQQYGN
jgi:cytochrome c551/c552